MNLLRCFVAVIFTLLVWMPQSLEAASLLTEKGYQLEKLLVFSRHNIRGTLIGEGSVIDAMTPYQWCKWSSPPGQLSLKGGIAETIMGQYFKKYLVEEGFMPENWQPEAGQVRFYANAFQRTIATAQYFSSGMLPVANVHIEHKGELGQTDYVFLNREPKSQAFKAKSDQYNRTIYGGEGVTLADMVADDLPAWERLMDFPHSAYAKQLGVKSLTRSEFVKAKGDSSYGKAVKDAIKTCDALLLQYYETAEDSQTAFGMPAAQADWEHIGHMCIMNARPHWDNPYEAWYRSHKALGVMAQELRNDQRRFTFLCGHDTNLRTILVSMQKEDYSLPETILHETPLGGKLVIEKRVKDGVAYGAVNFVYASDQQLRHLESLDLDNPPMVYSLKFQGLTPNEDGLYLYEDLLQRMDEAQAEKE